ncbi:hypothetical protein BHE74_00006160 [Ensete ventricosum]|nr:hypothetical protein BHE74_00006160 [Ensete ventricosum]
MYCPVRAVHTGRLEDCCFDMYRPVQAVHTSPPADRYVDCPLLGGTVSWGCFCPVITYWSISTSASDFEQYQPREGEGRRSRRKTRSRDALPLRYPLPVQSIARQQRNRPRAISSPNAGRRNVSPCGEKERGDIVNLRLYSVLGNSSIEAAINWVAEHEDDPDIDQMPLVW